MPDRSKLKSQDIQAKVNRTIRYQGAIIQDHQILLIKHQEHLGGRSYWVIPGGGMELGESEEECVRREMHEETYLNVHVVRLLLDEPGVPGGVYQRLKTYVCQIVEGQARPGYEPEVEAAEQYAITAVGWFDLRDSSTWDTQVFGDPFTYPLLQRVQAALGYAVSDLPEAE
jgi:ADP-ribose pyrophosphatase YjhB (NUDIX family)